MYLGGGVGAAYRVPGCPIIRPEVSHPCHGCPIPVPGPKWLFPGPKWASFLPKGQISANFRHFRQVLSFLGSLTAGSARLFAEKVPGISYQRSGRPLRGRRSPACQADKWVPAVAWTPVLRAAVAALRTCPDRQSGHSRAGWGTREYWRGGGPESKRAGLRGAPTSCQRGSATAEPSYPACAQARSHPGLDRAVIGTRGDPCPAPVPVWAARPRRPAAHPEVPLWRGRGPRVP